MTCFLMLERVKNMSRSKKVRYQPVMGREMSAAQEILYAKEFKEADRAGGYLKEKSNKEEA